MKNFSGDAGSESSMLVSSNHEYVHVVSTLQLHVARRDVHCCTHVASISARMLHIMGEGQVLKHHVETVLVEELLELCSATVNAPEVLEADLSSVKMLVRI